MGGAVAYDGPMLEPNLAPRSPLRRSAMRLLVAVAALVLLAGCLPSADPRFESARALDVERAAQEAYHRMEIGRIRTGAYTLEPLVDVALPRGARWSVRGTFGADVYQLRFASDLIPGVAWIVSPAGVRRVVEEG